MTKLPTAAMAALCLLLAAGPALAAPPKLAPLYGLYKAEVINNVDPLQAGRVLVAAPTAPGFPSSLWAWPCVPYSKSTTADNIAPPIGTLVWIEFQGGDVGQPVWVGWAPRNIDFGR